MNGCKANSICIWMPITRQDHSPCTARKAAPVDCMDGTSVQVFSMLWLKSFLEQQVLFTVKLTAGASSVEQLIRMETRVCITLHTFSGKENCSAGSPLVSGFSVLLGRVCTITVPPNGKQGSKTSCMPHSPPLRYSPITPVEL